MDGQSAPRPAPPRQVTVPARSPRGLIGVLEQLSNAIATGAGLPRPRRTGMVFLGLGVAFLLLNAVTVTQVQTVFPSLLASGAGLLPAGLWLVVTGEPATRADGSPTPTWARAGLGVAFGLGGLIGFMLYSWLVRH